MFREYTSVKVSVLSGVFFLTGCVIEETALPDPSTQVTCIDCLYTESGGQMIGGQNNEQTDGIDGGMSGGMSGGIEDALLGGILMGGMSGGQMGGMMNQCPSEDEVECEEDPPMCQALSPNSIVIIERGCWVCVDPRTCKPIAR